MRSFARTSQQPPRAKSAAFSTPSRAGAQHNRDVHSVLQLQRVIGNQAVQRLLPITSDSCAASRAGDESPEAGHDARQVRVHARAPRDRQTKLNVGSPGDRFEKEADRVADHVVRSSWADGGSSETKEAYSDIQQVATTIQPGSDLGKPLDASTNEEMSRKIGADFRHVRVHTDAPAVRLSNRLNARAFTYGSDIFFNEREYNAHSAPGKRLLAHELTHVVQQSRMDGGAQRQMIQRTTIGDVLDEFFSPFSSETLWVMPDGDNYTHIVRRWQPVIDAVNQAKTKLEADCANWSTSHMTNSSWTPDKTDPPVTDPNACGIWVSSPPGTDPDTCRNAFIIYVASKASPLGPNIQTFELYTCSIGSFGIYATVDSIDCAAKTAEMNIWMYNAMDQESFGRYASHPAFALSGMERQYMWWNWRESHRWSAGPGSAGVGGSGSGSSDWF